MILDKKDILEYQQNRDPYLMIDHVNEVEPGKYANGYKFLKENEWFFKVHWPKDPNMPGMLQIESLVQMAAISILTIPGNKGKIMYLVSANQLKFVKKILPGDRLDINTKVKTFKRGMGTFEGRGSVKGQTVCQAEFNLILPEEIKNFNMKI
tara:strand:- start:21302 stop:21757 length:456 start_codon:yes stop_codon:yes gene_type:complete